MIAMLRAQREREARKAEIHSTSNDEDIEILSTSGEPTIDRLPRGLNYVKDED